MKRINFAFRQLLIGLLIIPVFASFVPAQDEPEKPEERVLGEVTVTSKMANADPGYLEIRGLSDDSNAFSGEYATVNNLLLKKDVANFMLRSGEIYFLKEANGRRNGAVFIGDGEITLDPPVESERRMLKFFTDKTELKEEFSQLVMFFSDKTFEAIKNSTSAKMSTNGPQAGKARDAYRGKESLLKTSRFNYNMSTRILMDQYAPARRGFFWSFIDGKKYSSLVFKLDPLGVEEVSPEQVSLTNYDSDHYGIWLGFHLESEYEKGTGNSNQDRTVYDITHHNIDVTLRGLRMIATDEMTLKIRAEGQRVLPFNLFRFMRVKRILDEKGQDVAFIQEDKDKDGDLAVILPETRPVGEPFKLIFEYDGVESLTNEGTGNFILRSRTNWYPNNVGSRFLDRASFDLRFRYPKQYILVGVGELIDSADDEGDLKFAHWSTKGVEMATAGFNYGDFKKHELNDPNTGYELSVYNNTEVPAPLKSLLNQIGMIEKRSVQIRNGQSRDQYRRDQHLFDGKNRS
ncbi:MAG: hypothetical protein R2681_12500 [Pyrinomonadaceae bacterium]